MNTYKKKREEVQTKRKPSWSYCGKGISTRIKERRGCRSKGESGDSGPYFIKVPARQIAHEGGRGGEVKGVAKKKIMSDKRGRSLNNEHRCTAAHEASPKKKKERVLREPET